jgi:hypothetical protein
LRLLLAAVFLLSVALSLATDSRLWESRLDLESDRSLANAFSVSLWLTVAVLAGLLSKRGNARLGWLSVSVLATVVAIGEVYDFKDVLPPMSFSEEHQSEWLVAMAPLAIPLLILASRALLLEARTSTQRALLLASAVFALAPLVLDSVEPPFRIAEEGSELMAAVVLIALLISILGWIPLSPTFITRRLLATVIVFTAVAGGILGAREYWIPMSATRGDLPEIDHGPLSFVSQQLPVNRSYLSRIDVWADVTSDAADLFLRLELPGQPPIRESRTTTSHPRWSSQTVSFTFAPIPDSEGRTYELTIGALEATPYVFVGMSSDDPIPHSVAQINGVPDEWSNDLAIRAFARGRGIAKVTSMIQDRFHMDILVASEGLLIWLWSVVLIIWFTSSGAKGTGIASESRCEEKPKNAVE